MLQHIRAETKPGDAILALPYVPMLYFLSQRPSPARCDAVLPGFATPEIEEELIAAAENAAVGLVIVHDIALGMASRLAASPRIRRSSRAT